MDSLSFKELAKRVTLIGEVTAQTVDLGYFFDLEGESFITADFSIVPYELGKPIELMGGFQAPLMLGYEYILPDGRIVYSYDHHGPDERMQKMDVSSATLIEKVMQNRKTPFNQVYLTHTDTDSTLSAFMILTGFLDKRLSKAAIAADHTGAENTIADVLQPLTDLRDVEFSFACLIAILNNQPLPDEAKKRLAKRLEDRRRASMYVEGGVFKYAGEGVYIGEFEDSLPGELLPALIPEAKVIVLISSLRANRREIKVRAGLKFPSGKSLNLLGLKGYGGRWNAGSTKRFGGTSEQDVKGFITDLIQAVSMINE